MPSTNFVDAWEGFSQTLITGGVSNVILDARNIQAPCVLIDAPTFTGVSGSLWRFDYQVLVIAPPPGNADALKAMLGVVDQIAGLVPTSQGQPGVFSMPGGSDLPCYRLTCPTTYQRS